MPDRRPKQGRILLLLLAVTVIPCVLCSGMTYLIAGPAIAAKIYVIILALYLVSAASGMVLRVVLRVSPPAAGPPSDATNDDRR